MIWHSKHFFLCQHAVKERISSTSITGFIWRQRGWTQNVGTKPGNLLRWKRTAQNQSSLFCYPNTAMLLGHKQTQFSKKRAVGAEGKERQYLKVRAVIKTAIHWSFVARVAYEVLHKSGKKHLQQKSGTQNSPSSFLFELCMCILKNFQQIEKWDFIALNKMAHLQEQLAKSTFSTQQSVEKL